MLIRQSKGDGWTVDKEFLLQMEQELSNAVNHAIPEFSKFNLHVQVEIIENMLINAGVEKYATKKIHIPFKSIPE